MPPFSSLSNRSRGSDSVLGRCRNALNFSSRKFKEKQISPAITLYKKILSFPRQHRTLMRSYQGGDSYDFRSGFVAILVNDAKISAEWYREKLGFEVVEGIECAMWHGTESEGHAVSCDGTAVPCCISVKGARIGGCSTGRRTGIWLNCGEIALQRKGTGKVFPRAIQPMWKRPTGGEGEGVEFSMDLTTTSWGKMASWKDRMGMSWKFRKVCSKS